MKKSIHVLPHGDQWAVKVEGNQRASKVTDTQVEAIKLATNKAKNYETELVVHGKDGKIREKNSYGNDPRNIKG